MLYLNLIFKVASTCNSYKSVKYEMFFSQYLMLPCQCQLFFRETFESLIYSDFIVAYVYMYSYIQQEDDVAEKTIELDEQRKCSEAADQRRLYQMEEEGKAAHEHGRSMTEDAVRAAHGT